MKAIPTKKGGGVVNEKITFLMNGLKSVYMMSVILNLEKSDIKMMRRV